MKQGYGKKAMAANFKELAASKTKRPAKQRVAIVMETARKAAIKAGKPEKAPAMPRRPKGKAKGKSK